MIKLFGGLRGISENLSNRQTLIRQFDELFSKIGIPVAKKVLLPERMKSIALPKSRSKLQPKDEKANIDVTQNVTNNPAVDVIIKKNDKISQQQVELPKSEDSTVSEDQQLALKATYSLQEKGTNTTTEIASVNAPASCVKIIARAKKSSMSPPLLLSTTPETPKDHKAYSAPKGTSYPKVDENFFLPIPSAPPLIPQDNHNPKVNIIRIPTAKNIREPEVFIRSMPLPLSRERSLPLSLPPSIPPPPPPPPPLPALSSPRSSDKKVISIPDLPSNPVIVTAEVENNDLMNIVSKVTELVSQDVLYKGVFKLYSASKPQVVYIALDLTDGLTVRELLLSADASDINPDTFEIHVLLGGINIREVNLPVGLSTVVIIVANEGANAKIKPVLSTIVEYFLQQKITIKIAMPFAGDFNEVSTPIKLRDILSKKKGQSKAAKIVKNAIEITHVAELGLPSEALQTTLQKLNDQKFGILHRTPSTKESLESRIQGAVNIYSKAMPIGLDNVVAVNLWLRGITKVPNSIRSIMLPHPDLTDEENHKAATTVDQKMGIYAAMSSKSNLTGMVVKYNNAYWRIVSDARANNLDDESIIIIKNFKGTQTFTISKTKVKLDNNVINNPNVDILICEFKLYARVIPYYNADGILTGVERTFFSFDADKLRPESVKSKLGEGVFVRSKLARGLLSGSSAIFHDTDNPVYDLRGEGSENVLSVLEVLDHQSKVAKHLGLITESHLVDGKKSNTNYRVSTCMGTNDLCKMPLHSITHTVIIIADNDGYNMETHRALIEAVEYFLAKKLTVKIVLPVARCLGKKIDLNDVLVKDGVEAAGKVLQQAVRVNSKSDLGLPGESLQLHFQKMCLSEQLTSLPAQLKATGWLELGNVFFKLKNYDQALNCYKQSLTENAKFINEQSTILAAILCALGNTYVKLGNYTQALDYYKTCLNLKIKDYSKEDRIVIGLTHRGMGDVYFKQGEYKSALSSYKESLNIKKGEFPTEDHIEIAVTFKSLGELHLQWQKYPQALHYFTKSHRILNKILGTGDWLEIADILEKLGDVHYKQQDYYWALYYYNKSAEVKTRAFCCEIHGFDEEILLKIGKANFLQGKYVNSLSYYLRSFNTKKAKFTSKVLELLLQRGDHILKQQAVHDEAQKKVLTSNPVSAVQSATVVKPTPTAASSSVQLSVEGKQQQTATTASNNTQMAINQKFKTTILPAPPSIKKAQLDHAAQFLLFKNYTTPLGLQVVIDVEATGDKMAADRITDIGAVKLFDGKVIDTFQSYVDPAREVRHEAYRITGLTWKFLRNFPSFGAIAPKLLQFIDGADLIMHGANFDVTIINKELKLCGNLYGDIEKKHKIIDTLLLAQKMHPGQKNSLDALCERYMIDNSKRIKHGALIDARLTAEVYLAMNIGAVKIEQSKFGVFKKF